MNKKKTEDLLEKHYQKYLKLALNNQDLGILEGIIEQTFYAGAASGAALIADLVSEGKSLEEIWENHIKPPMEKFV